MRLTATSVRSADLHARPTHPIDQNPFFQLGSENISRQQVGPGLLRELEKIPSRYDCGDWRQLRA